MCLKITRPKGIVYIPYRYGNLMFSTERSDFGSTIAGYFFAAILLILGGLQFLNLQIELFDTTNPVPFRILAILLVVSGAIALWKAYIIDGVTFMIVALAGSGFMIATMDPMFMITIAIAALATAFMAFRVGDYFVLGLNVVVAIAVVLISLIEDVDFISDNPVIAGIFFLIGGAIAGYLCLSDWMLVQDIAMDYEEEIFGDCCCDDDCECGDDCGDDCECHCHDEEPASEEVKEE